MKKDLSLLNLVLLGVLTTSVIANQVVLSRTNTVMGIQSSLPSISANFKKIIGGGAKLTGDLAQDAVKLVFMQGVPEVYGAELGLNFDEVQGGIDIMRRYDPDYGNIKLDLSAEELKRYINVASKISCEYCCGAESIIFSNGKAACGCAHSQAMRGLIAYLIKKHGAQYTDDQVLAEAAKWKSRYFPKQMVQKMSTELKSGKYTPDISSLLLNVKLPKYDGAANTGAAPLPSEIQNAPGMVGGC